MTLLDLAEKLEHLADRLPGPLRKPLLREITPVKDLFLRQRPPRLLLLGSQEASREKLVNALFGSDVAPADPTDSAGGYWQSFSRAGKGTLRCLDARNRAKIGLVKSALGSERPDLILYLSGNRETASPETGDYAEQLIQFLRNRGEQPVPIIGVDVRDRSDQSDSGTPEMDVDRLAEAITSALPDDAKLEMARLCSVRSAQTHIAQILTRSLTAISGAIGTQPIPLADFPILTSLQGTLVAGIMYVSGREVTTKLAAEFIAALGANISAGLVFRESARALLKLFPGWGNAISGAIASAGTYAVGRAATLYFIEGASLSDARKLFHRGRKSAIDIERLGR